jgi:hypothetical protein
VGSPGGVGFGLLLPVGFWEFMRGATSALIRSFSCFFWGWVASDLRCDFSWNLLGFLAFFQESGVCFGHFTNLVVFAFGFFSRSSGACALALTTAWFCFGLSAIAKLDLGS